MDSETLRNAPCLPAIDTAFVAMLPWGRSKDEPLRPSPAGPAHFAPLIWGMVALPVLVLAALMVPGGR